MNTIVAIVLPEWMVWVLALLAVLSAIQSSMQIYSAWLRAKIEKMKGRP